MTEFMTYASMATPLITDAVLIGAALLFIARLYLVERQFEEGLLGFELDYLKKKLNTSFVPLPEDQWFLADGFEYRLATESQCRRLHTFKKIAKILILAMIAIGTFFGAGALFAATSTGSLAVSAIVLSRCVIRFPSLGSKAESACTDGVVATTSVSERKIDKAKTSSGSSQESGNTTTTDSETPIVTLAY